MTPTPPVPPVSPTGQAVVSQILTRVALAVFAVAGAIALAPTAGVDVSFLPPLVPKVCALVAFVAATMGFAGPGLRKLSMVLLVCTVGLASCAHAPTPLVVTGDALDAGAITFEATASGMKTASDAHALSRDQVLAWNAFLPKFKASYHAACAAWRAAKDAGDESTATQIGAALGALLSQLGTFTAMLAKPAGGAS